MAKRIERAAILTALRRRIAAGEAVLAFGAGSGMSAKCAEKGGADYISVYTTAFCRMEGVPSALAWLPYGNVNEEMRTASKKILPLVKNTPCVAGLGVHDPRIEISELIDEFASMGYSGVSNEPFCSMYGPSLCALLNREGIGFDRELELMRIAGEKDLFTAAWAADPMEAERFADAGVDVIGVLAGLEKEPGEDAETHLSRVLRFVAEVTAAARRRRPDVIVLAHGGPINNVTAAQRAILEAGVDGYATGSSGERVPAEEAITEITRSYARMRLR
jgi:predicted TIM-barrel enzyme